MAILKGLKGVIKSDSCRVGRMERSGVIRREATLNPPFATIRSNFVNFMNQNIPRRFGGCSEALPTLQDNKTSLLI